VNIEYPEKRTNNKEMLPQVVERIFAICKTDSNFALKNKMTNVDEKLSSYQTQINKQDKLIEQSKGLTTNIVTRLTNLKKSNQELRDRLLEALGSEI
jgi:septal ring factor EnvC (AmiA/AmiB activator)